MDFQLKKTAKDYPGFFSIAENAIKTAYKTAWVQMPPDMQRDRLCGQRLGYYVLANVDHELRRAFENANFDGVTISDKANSNGSNYHLEIRTPHAVFMAAKVLRQESVPRKTSYRQQYLDQIFMPAIFPEYKPFTEDCVPLYIITHVMFRGKNEPSFINVGRIEADQKRWACRYPIGEIHKGQSLEEIVEKRSVPAFQENIAINPDRIKIKQ